MVTVDCPYCDEQYEVDLVEDTKIKDISRSDSMERPSGTILCSNEHVFYLIY